MENKLTCPIVRDLLPSYVDGLTCAQTNEAVAAHLADCPDCRKIEQDMRAPEETKAVTAPEVDYLKKVRCKTNRKALVISVCLLLVGLGIIGYLSFGVGHKASVQDVALYAEVTGQEIRLSGDFISSSDALARMTFSQSNEMVDVTVYSAPKTFFNRGEISGVYTAAAPVKQIRMNGVIVWQDGENVLTMAAQLYNSKNPFVGDMPANSQIAGELRISDLLGPYTNELQTETEPYGWKFLLQTAGQSENLAAMESDMRMYSEMLMMTVDNLGYVTWVYPTPTGTQTFTVTREEYGGKLEAWSEDLFAFQSRCEALLARLYGSLAES
jgi:hypothetical protein